MPTYASANLVTYYICLGKTRWDSDQKALVACRRLIVSSQWDMHDEPAANVRHAGQRWYCSCRSRYKISYGLLAAVGDVSDRVRCYRVNSPTLDVDVNLAASHAGRAINLPALLQNQGDGQTGNTFADITDHDDDGYLYVREHVDLCAMPAVSWSDLIGLITAMTPGVISCSSHDVMEPSASPKVSMGKCALCRVRFSSNKKMKRRAAKCKGWVWSQDKNGYVKCLAWVCRFDNECTRAGDPCPCCHSRKPAEVLQDSRVAICESESGQVPRWQIPPTAVRYLHNGRFAARWDEEV